MATLRRDVYGEVGRAIKSLGFRKAAGKQLFTKDFASGVVGTLGITASRRGEWLAVSLGVGLIATDVERLIAEWCDESPQGRFTFASNVGYLKPERSWLDARFSEDSPIDEGVHRLTDLTSSVAVPFLEEHASLKGVASVLESGILPRPNRFADERLPVIYALDGNWPRATASFAKIVKALNSDDVHIFRRHAYVDGYRKTFPDVKS